MPQDMKPFSMAWEQFLIAKRSMLSEYRLICITW